LGQHTQDKDGSELQQNGVSQMEFLFTLERSAPSPEKSNDLPDSMLTNPWPVNGFEFQQAAFCVHVAAHSIGMGLVVH